ncbi:MAG: SufB/SufD family protein [Chlamydiota bacterium]
MNSSSFLLDLEDHYRSLPRSKLRKLRQQGWQKFSSLGLPKYTKLPLRELQKISCRPPEDTSIKEGDISPHLASECFSSRIVFVNGRYSEKLSDYSAFPSEVVIKPLEKALGTYGPTLNKHLQASTNPFYHLNTALHEEGLFIYLPPGTIIQQPVQILNVIDAEHAILHPRINIFAGDKAAATFYSNAALYSANNCWVNSVYDFMISDSAKINFESHHSKVPHDIFYFENLEGTLKKQSSFKGVTVTDGAYGINEISLAGESSQAELYGLTMLAADQEAHHTVNINHRVPHTYSSQLFKAVANGESRSSFEGKIYIDRLAQQSDAQQLNKNLLLSERATASSKPSLEIFADDVKATHGATTGSLDCEQLFYLESRGLSASQARNLVIGGFCREICDHFSLESVKEKLYQSTKNYIQ